MKINVFSIIRDHLITLYDDRSSKFSICDLVLFYVFPIIISTLSYLFNYYFSVEIYNISITFFGIFIALLLNMQIAIFSIFQRKWDIPTDEISKELKNDTLKDRKKILKELNANISYLILVCCASLVISLIFYAQHLESTVCSSISLFLYLHFLLTLLMVIKRSHALFQKEYEESS